MFLIFLLLCLQLIILISADNRPNIERCLTDNIHITKDSFIAALHYFKECQELAATLNDQDREIYLNELNKRLKECKDEFMQHIVGKAEDVHYMIQAFNDLSNQFERKQPQAKEIHIKSNSESKSKSKNTSASREDNANQKCYDEYVDDGSNNKTLWDICYSFLTFLILLILVLLTVITFILCRLLRTLCVRTVIVR